MFEKENILKLFFEKPQREFHLREIARIVKISSSTAKKYLDSLEREAIIISRKERHLRIFTANLESRKYKQLKINYNIMKIINSNMLDYLDKEMNFPTVVLFGSWAHGENGIHSDIDLFILTNSKKKIDLSKFERRLGAEIQLFILSTKEFNEMKRKNKELVNSIINGITLSGFLKVL
jgi:predicted nucleotidyltransferase